MKRYLRQLRNQGHSRGGEVFPVAFQTRPNDDGVSVHCDEPTGPEAIDIDQYLSHPWLERDKIGLCAVTVTDLTEVNVPLPLLRDEEVADDPWYKLHHLFPALDPDSEERRAQLLANRATANGIIRRFEHHKKGLI